MRSIEFVAVIKYLNMNEDAVRLIFERLCPGEYYCRHFENLRRKDIIGIVDITDYDQVFNRGVPSDLGRFIERIAIIDEH
ncbi:hypothetical protein HZA97_01760 [Candidatus Woesearchaeota archaeon]|nr:hypothetical protein [Candidatus Woesearchaeota archaeon]